MFVFNILVLTFAAILTLIQAFKDYRNNQNITLLKVVLIIIIVGLGLSITSEFLKKSDEVKAARNRESEYLSIIGRADTTLKRVDSNLQISDSILGNTDSSITRLEALQDSAGNLNISMANELQIQGKIIRVSNELLAKSQLIMKSQEDVLQKNKQLLGSQSELLSIFLMDKFIVPKIRIVFSYKDPISKGDFHGPKFGTSKLNEENIEHGRGVRAENLFPHYRDYGYDSQLHPLHPLYLRLYVEGFVDENIAVPIMSEPAIITIPYREEDGRYCIAFEFIPYAKMNLAQFYNQIKNATSEIFIQKNYNGIISMESVIGNENKFKNQDVQVYLEAPLEMSTGTWFRINLISKGDYSIKKNSTQEYDYYSVKYIWEAEKSFESLLIYNE